MALHRKQRGPADALPQFVRLPAARAAPSPVASASARHPRKPRHRLVYPAPRQQISSLQLRACFLLCVLLYFGTIYFADNIASLGEALGAEPARGSHDFFVQSDAPVQAAAAHMRGAGAGDREQDAAERESEPEGAVPEEQHEEERRDDAPPPPPAPDRAQDAAKKADEPDGDVPVEEGLIPAEMVEREPEKQERVAVHFPAQAQPQRVVRDAEDTPVGDAKGVLPEQKNEPHSEPVTAVAAAETPAHAATPAVTAARMAPREPDVDNPAAEAEHEDGQAPKAALHGAPADELPPGDKRERRAAEQEEPAPHEEHR